MHIYPSLSHRSKEPEKGVLYIVGTPIGNLNDISFRAINILKNVSLIACEDTRQTRKILNKFELKNSLESFNKNNSTIKIPKIIKFLKEDKSIALVSDAGMPNICDPGEDLVKKAKLSGIDVFCIPGPCAAIAALVSSGMPSSKFIFEGFLPTKKKDRQEILLEISNNEKTSILFESPHRLKKLLNELKNYCGGDREIHVCRELTKKFEEHFFHSIDNVLESLKDREIKGEFTIILRGIDKTNLEFNELKLKEELFDLRNAGLSLSAASKYLAKKNNLAKSIIYNLH